MSVSNATVDSTKTWRDQWLQHRQQWLRKLKDEPIANVKAYAQQQIPANLLPLAYIDSLQPAKQKRCLIYCLVCWLFTSKKHCPRELQLAAALGVSDLGSGDVFLNVGTGSGKTLAAILNQLLDDDARLTLIISPLKRLQNSQALDIYRIYGIETAVINEDTPHSSAYWDIVIHNRKTRSPGSARILIVTPEQFFRIEGVNTCSTFGSLMRERSFTSRISLVVLDEGHYTSTAGKPHYGLKAFRPVYGKLKQIRNMLGNVPWLVMTATAPSHMLRDIETLVLRSEYLSLRQSTNRPNIAYATHCVTKSLSDLKNFNCLIKRPFSLENQPRVLIFRENTDATVALALHLDLELPEEFQGQDVVQHYHSSMSTSYLTRVHNAFTTPGSKCRILVATSAESTGIDFPDVDIVCVAGIPENLALMIQMFGRAARKPDSTGLAVLFYEPWALELDLADYRSPSNENADDLDRPRAATLKEKHSQQDRIGLASAELILKDVCIRSQFATYLDDHDTNGMAYLYMVDDVLMIYYESLRV